MLLTSTENKLKQVDTPYPHKGRGAYGRIGETTGKVETL